MYMQNLKDESWYVKRICLVFSLCFLAACPAAAAYLNVWDEVWSDWLFILVTPAPLITDYFQIGNLASAFLNAGICGLSCNLLMYGLKADCRLNSFAGYFLVVAHCFYGLNFLNMWPPILGILLFCRFFKINFKDNLAISLFATAFGPFISELLFRYHVSDAFEIFETQIGWLGFLYAVLFSIFLGFAIPAMLPGALRLHKGFTLYNGGLAFGLLGILLYAFMYKTFGIQTPENYILANPIYTAHNSSYLEFSVIFFSIVFSIFLIWGWFTNGKTFKGYGQLIKSSGYNISFMDTFGMPRVLINIGVYGFMILAYFTIVVLFTDGAGFTGATVGIVLAALSFSAKGQHPRNVLPVLLGYALLSALVSVICTIGGLNIPWTLSTQGYMNGAAFATGLCPISGYFGKRWGIAAGFLCAIMCTSTSAMHGGFMLYNGGFTAGITALILIPCLEYYWKGTPK
ncbi:MAG: DUF1576 domain-containing protein [Schaedlerella sp.]|nr:DUF1576 domain-containing protein [Schaedlerella sp.]